MSTPAPTRPERPAKPARSQRPFQLALTCGAHPERVAAVADTLIDLTPVTPGVDGALQTLAASGLSPADVRSKAVFIVEGDHLVALTVYAAVSGFAGRFVDVATRDGVVLFERLHDRAASAEDTGRPEVREDLVRVVPDPVPEDGSAVATAALESLTAELVTTLRFAKRVSFCPTADTYRAFTELATITGARSRRDFERMPILDVTGCEVDLDDLRRQGAASRRARRDYTACLVEPAVQNDRRARLVEAAAVPVAQVLAALGSVERDGMWNCPRPWSHTHGDATPSMQVDGELARCFVDDAEWVDSVRLVVETCNVTPDDAASLLLSGPWAFAPYADRARAERDRRNT
jgi:hypothetical protein